MKKLLLLLLFIPLVNCSDDSFVDLFNSNKYHKHSIHLLII